MKKLYNTLINYFCLFLLILNQSISRFRTLIQGDKTAGFSIFWADDGLDTGPILLQKSCKVELNDTVDSLYNNFLYPEGIKAMGDAVNLVAKGTAPMVPQPAEGATYDPLLNKKELQKIDWTKPAKELHNFIRGLDSTPGACTTLDARKCDSSDHLYGAINNQKSKRRSISRSRKESFIREVC